MDISAAYRNTIIGLMILTGAMNTIGTILLMQHIDIKIGRWSTRAPTTSSSFIPTCKQPPCSWDKPCVISFSLSKSGGILTLTK